MNVCSARPRPGIWAPWWRLLMGFIALSTVLRLGLLLHTGDRADLHWWSVLHVLGLGLAFDVIAGLAFCAPLAVFLAVWPRRAYAHPLGRFWLSAGYVLWCFLLLCVAASEIVFWEEFGTRFNFIAVDYLLYTHEVIGNIRESYPVGLWLSAVALVAMGLVALNRRVWLAERAAPAGGVMRDRVWPMVLRLALCALGLWMGQASWKHSLSHPQDQSLSGNGVFEFFSALRHNELDYEHFYQSLPTEEALRRMRQQLPTPHARLASDDPHDLTRRVDYGEAEKRWNVVLISVESLSADFMARFGNRQGLTPRLDALARQSLLFTHLYATGTRTVRGLEALSLAVPPTPGQSIVKRPHNEGLFTLGQVFHDKGYDTRYVYGGYGYFDNMNAFFSANGYEVVDRGAMVSAEVHHENIWGVADEDLFTLALRQADASHARGRPSFMHVMTTSNHRPFTYPEGRIDIPSKTGRDGGVKYTDWAIGDFIDRASHKPWFAHTLFVIVADHCASSAGKTDLPVERYHIPAMVFAPGLVAPREEGRLASQIDLAPTLLGLLKFRYHSRFMGHDLMDLEPGRERAFISTYQDLGVLRGDRLLRLDPREGAHVVKVLDGHATPEPAAMDWDDVADAISWYQSAAWAYHHDGLRALSVNTVAHANTADRRR
ncbi:alkaline phosphatase family protein [Aquabacterium lacunae]|uniref:Alkaline phosphatase family protein n=1 Tax=Aquabacterium lacunae TaxID=2528630 RepID=A0A4Q9H5E9_9BURK|nr:alkaline phosphatase family protein [Aquabacterium lacunae]TBO33904.1 alkaline phosphatase family protein [Aquabacterium lacunae]